MDKLGCNLLYSRANEISRNCYHHPITQWADAIDKQTFEVYDPASKECIATLPDMNVSETNDAIETAQLSLNAWQSFTAQARCG